MSKARKQSLDMSTAKKWGTDFAADCVGRKTVISMMKGWDFGPRSIARVLRAFDAQMRRDGY